jgi:signal transduction histidine kinase/CheY-like chemotaxis protein
VITSASERTQLEALIQTLPGALIEVHMSAEGRCRFPRAGAGAAELLGFPTAELEADGDPVIARIHVEDRQHVLDTQAEALRSGGVWRCEFRYQHAAQGERWLACTAVPKHDAHDTTWDAILLDITLQKRTEADLALAEAQLSSALEAADMGAWIFDSDTGKVWGNRQQRVMWETPQDEPPWYDKSNCLAQIHEDDRAGALAVLMRALSGEPLRNEFRIVRSDGSMRWIAGRARAEAGSPGRGKRVAGVNLDITQQKMLAEKALRSQKLEVLGTLASGIAHDFNNVLFAIMGNADVAMLEASLGRDPQPMLHELRSATERAADLIRQILAFSRPDEQPNQVIELSEAIRGALTIVRATTPSMINVTTRFDPGAPAVRADDSRLGQIVVNLCTNAVHAIGKGRAGRVDVCLKPVRISGDGAAHLAHIPDGLYAVLSVTDDGCGMNEATMARIFDPFFTTKRPGTGTGLGLSIVHKVAQGVGAHIAVQSTPGQGTCFEVYFPAAEPDSVEAAALPEETGRGEAQQIMFVDDEPMLVRMGSNLLRSLGYRPDAYSQATEALAAFERNPHAYAVIITDLSMPVLSGIELARRMLALRADVPIVLMSGNIAPDEHAAALRAGIREAVVKPTNLATLGAVIARLC